MTVKQRQPGIRIEYVLAIFITLLVLLAVYQILAPSMPPAPSGATKLTLIAPSTAKVGETVVLTLRAVDESGNIDPRRSDTISLSLNQGTHATIAESTLTLANGEASTTITDEYAEVVTVTASWVSGYSFLEHSTVTIRFE